MCIKEILCVFFDFLVEYISKLFNYMYYDMLFFVQGVMGLQGIMGYFGLCGIKVSYFYIVLSGILV